MATIMALAASAVGVKLSTVAVYARSTLHVPSQYSTIQGAVNAASPGDTILVRSGIYAEQISIGKSLTLRGAGDEGRTIIQAPAVLAPDSIGRTSIVEIRNRATVKISNLSVSGPGRGSCGNGSLGAGILVVEGATLDLKSARVTHIHDTPSHDCNHHGDAILVGSFVNGQVGHATIRDVEISDYQNNGVVAFSHGSDVTVEHSTITGPGLDPSLVVDPGGLSVGDGAVARVSHNVIRQNYCTSPELFCGPDEINDIQSFAISNGPGDPPGPGTVFADNEISDNDGGMILFGVRDCCGAHHNALANNRYFGIVLGDGANTFSHDRISGGNFGVVVVALGVDTAATLDHERISGSSVAPTQLLQCCGFTATIRFKT